VVRGRDDRWILGDGRCSDHPLPRPATALMPRRIVDRTRGELVATLLAGVQWLFFLFANTVVIPLSIGRAFHLAPAVVTASVDRSFVLTGLACLLQVGIGHRLPLLEGSTGLWWAALLDIAVGAGATGQAAGRLGGELAVGIVVAGALVGVLGALGLGPSLRRLFSPVVMSAFYFLLAAQLVGIFVRGMVGLADGSHIQPRVALLSFGLVALVMALSLAGRGLVANFALLIGIAVGWPAFRLIIPSRTPDPAPAGAALFGLFPWGAPALDAGVIATAVFIGLLNTTNTVASLEGAEELYGTPSRADQYRRSFLVTGMVTVLAGILGLVPYGPYTSTLGFLRTTRILARAPFALGALLFILLGAIPALGRVFSTLPLSVGDAVLFVAYLQLFGSALARLEGLRFSSRTVYRIATPVLLGLAVMTMPAAVWTSLPGALRPLLGNGLVVGIILAIVLDNAVRWDRVEAQR